MNSASLFLISTLLAFSSIISGVFLSYFVKEELTPGKKYFKMFQEGLIFIILLLFLYFNQSILFFILIPVLFIALKFIEPYQYSLYFGMLFLLFFSYIYNGFEYVWTLVFLYGFLMSAYFCSNHQKIKKKDAILVLIKNNSSFLLGSLASFLFLLIY